MKSKLEKYSKVIYNRLQNYETNNIVEIRSSFELTQTQLSQLKTALAKRFAIQPNFKVVIDPTLIGGLTIKINSEIIDSSLKSKLNQIIKLDEKEGA